jgi:hypothetical protein
MAWRNQFKFSHNALTLNKTILCTKKYRISIQLNQKDVKSAKKEHPRVFAPTGVPFKTSLKLTAHYLQFSESYSSALSDTFCALLLLFEEFLALFFELFEPLFKQSE